MFALKRTLAKPSRSILWKSLHTLPELTYSYDALVPIISKDIMELHHMKYHKTYVTNLNEIEKKMKEALSKQDVNEVARLTPYLKFNGGGHINHCIFWKNLSPEGGDPSEELCEAFTRDFGDFRGFKKELQTLANGIHGGGWAWLGYNRGYKRLELVALENQDPLEGTTGLVPLLGIDVFEHAYHLQYSNRRSQYVEKIFEIINWEDVSERYKEACTREPPAPLTFQRSD
ncbi:unnamed protein product [Nezara viridula]|uniref:Superoxide dismutase n=1 Tax=Nezara viridula TaxID=85310 RepID=A0A9P0E4K1_NEZVI|nr:unnamed protein product [Nezara viridula]